MGIDLTRIGFVIENEWYWKITENAQSLDVVSAVRDFLGPLARHAKDKVPLTDIAADLAEVRFAVKGDPVAIKIGAGVHDRVALNHFVGEINRSIAGTGYAFALVVPRRYELRGVLISVDDLASLAGNPALLIPSSRPSWRAISTP